MPYLIAFISVDAGYSEANRAALLSSFTAGYVTMQIPGSYLARAIGNKAVCLINNLSLAALLALLPTLARSGPTLVGAAVACVGVLQGPISR